MNKYELYCAIFHVIDAKWEETKNDGLREWLSDMNPYIWKECTSADPATYAMYEKWIGKKNITLENSYDIAKEYIYSINDDYYDLEEIRKVINSVNRDKWIEMCKDFLSKPHKGENI